MNALHTRSRTFFFTILLGLLAAPGTLFAQNQTNDPLVDEQQYLFDVHRVGQAWNYTTGSSDVTIGVYSMTGFIESHEDLSSDRVSRLSTGFGPLEPELDIASEMVGILGANTDNGVGMAGIDRASTVQNFTLLTEGRTCDNDSRCSIEGNEEPEVNVERPDGTQKIYYLNLYNFRDLIYRARNNKVDVHIFSFGLPSGDPADYPVEGIEDPTLFMNLSEIGPEEDPTPDPYGVLASALRTAGQRVANSLCGGWFGDCIDPPDPASLFRDQVGFAVARDDGVVVTPAGNLNENGDVPPRHLPGMFDPYAVTVGGIQYQNGRNSDLIKWDRTRPANYVDVAAFAENVVGLSGTGSTAYDTDFSSTAASASIGAGVSGLLKAEMPALTGEDIEEILKRTAREAGAPGEDNATGAGAIDAGAALGYVRNNDVQRSKQGVDEVISDKVVGTDTELRGNGFWQYTSTNCQRPKGDLHKFRARVPYSQTFSSAPDAWTRWGQSDGLKSSGREDGAYYDPLVKELRVVDADRTGLTVEGYYWVADFYNRYGQRCAKNIPIPKKPANFKVAYTAVGTEGPPPLEVSLSGPTSLNAGQEGTWTADVSGGEGSPSYDWEYRPAGSSTWYDENCGGSTCSRTFYGGDYENGGVRATVTKGAESETATTTVFITPNCQGDRICLKTPGRTVAIQAPDVQPRPDRTAALTWSASARPPVSHFEVEHRVDSTGTWSPLGTVPVGDSVRTDSTGPAYRFETDDLEVGTHQFRLAVAAPSDRRPTPVQAVGTADKNGGRTWTSEAVTARIEVDGAFELSAYPNPVRERATVRLAVKEQQHVAVEVYDVLGRRAATLHEGPVPARETTRFGLETAEAGLSSGTYFVRVRGETFAATRQLTVVR